MIEFESVSRTYGSFQALTQVSFTCRPGHVTGFLGPNGAGKSTAMRVLTGLTPATSGRATIGGHAFTDLPNPGRHVGVLLDASAQHGGRTGHEAIALAARTMGVPRARVDEVLELVGLTPAETRRRVRHYSLGMRQRLGIASALLGDPQVLVLDEPANGLDPAGIRWMRDLLKSFADRGGTVLLSSHLLHEVERIADELVLIGRGRIVAQGDKTALLSGTATGTHVGSLDDESLGRALAASGHDVDRSPAGLTTSATPEQVGRHALEAHVVLTDLRTAQGGLEDLFIELTAGSSRDGAASARHDQTGVPA